MNITGSRIRGLKKKTLQEVHAWGGALCTLQEVELQGGLRRLQEVQLQGGVL